METAKIRGKGLVDQSPEPYHPIEFSIILKLFTKAEKNLPFFENLLKVFNCTRTVYKVPGKIFSLHMPSPPNPGL